MSNVRFHLPPRQILIGLGLIILAYFYFTHSYAPNLGSAARGGNWNLDAEDSTGMKPPYKGGAHSVGTGMINPTMPCRDLPGSKDVVVVIKTDATELMERLPVHVRQTRRCYPNLVVYSDYDETFNDVSVIDILKDYPKEMRETHKDFELSRRVHSLVSFVPGGPTFPQGRNALNNSERAGPISRPTYIKGVREDVAGRLDKWKYAPMMKKTLQEYDSKKWFVFIETDTYIFWKTLLNYLGGLDYTSPYYIGSQSYLGEQIFASAGAGIVVSHAALEQVVHNFDAYPKEWEEYTSSQWAGDAILGKAFKNAGVNLLPAWPMFQSESVTKLDFDRIVDQKRLWCHPVISYHNLSPWFVEDLFIFEAEWILRTRNNRDAVLTHRDVYHDFVLPRVKVPKMHWNNFAEDDVGPSETVAQCLRECFQQDDCVMYRLSADMRCYISSRPHLGEPSRGVESGWIYDRMEKWYKNQPPCGGEGFFSS